MGTVALRSPSGSHRQRGLTGVLTHPELPWYPQRFGQSRSEGCTSRTSRPRRSGRHGSLSVPRTRCLEMTRFTEGLPPQRAGGSGVFTSSGEKVCDKGLKSTGHIPATPARLLGPNIPHQQRNSVLGPLPAVAAPRERWLTAEWGSRCGAGCEVHLRRKQWSNIRHRCCR